MPRAPPSQGMFARAQRPPRVRTAACWACRVRRVKCPRDGGTCGRCRSHGFPCAWPEGSACGVRAATAPSAAAYLRAAAALGASLAVEKTACVRCRASRRGCDGDRRGCGRCEAAGAVCEYPPPRMPRKCASENISASSGNGDASDSDDCGPAEEPPSSTDAGSAATPGSGDGRTLPSVGPLAPSSFPRVVSLPPIPTSLLEDQEPALIPDLFIPSLSAACFAVCGTPLWADPDPLFPWVRALHGEHGPTSRTAGSLDFLQLPVDEWVSLGSPAGPLEDSCEAIYHDV